MGVVLGNFMCPCGTETGKCEFSPRLLSRSSPRAFLQDAAYQGLKPITFQELASLPS